MRHLTFLLIALIMTLLGVFAEQKMYQAGHEIFQISPSQELKTEVNDENDYKTNPEGGKNSNKGQWRLIYYVVNKVLMPFFIGWAVTRFTKQFKNTVIIIINILHDKKANKP